MPGSLLVIASGTQDSYQELIDPISPADVQFLTPQAYLEHTSDSPRYDVGLVIDALEHVTPEDAGLIISRLRDLVCKRLFVVVNLADQSPENQSHWHNTDLIAFGLKAIKIDSQGDENVGLYHYDIYDYKSTPDWLNSKNWANPDRWNKNRW